MNNQATEADDFDHHVNKDRVGETLTVIHNTADDEGGFDHSSVEGGRHVMPAIAEVLSGTRIQIEELEAIELDLSEEEPGNPLARYLEPIAAHTEKAAEQVYEAFMKGNKVLSLGGNHVRALDVIGALRACHEQGIKMGMVWVDAHPDLNTPDSTPSGHVHGMPSAVLQGKGPKELLDLLKGAPFIDPKDFIYVGVNAIDDPKHEDGRADTELQYLRELKALGVRCYTMESMKEDRTKGRVPDEVKVAVSELNDRIKADGGKMWVEWDVDVVDQTDMPAAVMDNPDGMSVQQIKDLFNHIGSQCDVDGVGVSEVAPDKDADGRGRKLVAEGVGHLFGVSNPSFSIHTSRSLAEFAGQPDAQRKVRFPVLKTALGVSAVALAALAAVLSQLPRKPNATDAPAPAVDSKHADFLASFKRTNFIAVAGRLRMMADQHNQQGVEEALDELADIYQANAQFAPTSAAELDLRRQAASDLLSGFSGGTQTGDADVDKYRNDFLKRISQPSTE